MGQWNFWWIVCRKFFPHPVNTPNPSSTSAEGARRRRPSGHSVWLSRPSPTTKSRGYVLPKNCNRYYGAVKMEGWRHIWIYRSGFSHAGSNRLTILCVFSDNYQDQRAHIPQMRCARLNFYLEMAAKLCEWQFHQRCLQLFPAHFKRIALWQF